MTLDKIGALNKSKQRFYLFGEHIQKSKSPLLQNTTFKELGLDWEYCLLDSSNIKAFNERFKNENLIGSAVTMPNKVRAVTEVADAVDDIGKVCGSINTIYLQKEKGTSKILKYGTNTDTIGIKESFLQNFPTETIQGQNSPGLVYGGGGACRAGVYALYNLLGASKIYIVNRFKEEVDEVRDSMKRNGFQGEIIHITDPEMAKTVEPPKLLVLTVPNFAPVTEEERLARDTLEVFRSQDSPGVALEMCYHPVIETTLYNEFKQANWKVITGVEAMIYQGFAQIALWSGLSFDQLPIQKVIGVIYSELKKEISD